MARMRFQGPLSTRISSFLALNRIALQTYARHATRRRLDQRWSAEMEIGIRFCRHQFTRAMRHGDIRKGRVILDSVQTQTDDVYDVRMETSAHPKGTWHHPAAQKRDCLLLYFHGGGYTFNGAVSTRFAQMLAHRIGADLFAPDYRLTPEHPHPAQADDALAAWRYVTQRTPPEKIVVIGDSAGGHMALGLLQTLKREQLPQPALCIGLCPWTDIGARGQSLSGNDRYDLVQGWMALQFGVWLDPEDRYGRAALSPIAHDYAGLAPLYLQAGGREVLRDMICDFANLQEQNGAPVMLDLWPDMPHDFQAYDSFQPSASQALLCVGAAIDAHLGEACQMDVLEGVTVLASHAWFSQPR